jgi:hypothetical protein
MISYSKSIALALALVSTVACLDGNGTALQEYQGTVSDLDGAFGSLVNSTVTDSFLVVTVQGTEDFLQFYPDKGNIFLDFPVITARQKAVEPLLLKSAERLGVTIEETFGSDGSRFCTAKIGGSAEEAASVTTELLEELFGASRQSALVLSLNI